MTTKKYQLSFRSVFLIIFILETGFFLWQVLTHRISAGHDTIQYFILQYYFLNHLVCHGEIPQWMPYMTQGTISAWWFSIQAGFFQNALMIFHPFLKTINFATLFTVGIFWEHLFLLCGVWLWGRIHFKNPWTMLLFCSSIMGSTIWMNQIWFNFHLYYALPLIFFFVHKFLQTSLWRWFFLAGQLWLLQSFGNMPYFLPMTGWILFSYFVLFLIQNPHIFTDCIKRLNWITGGAVILVQMLTAWLYFYLTTYGTAQIINYNVGRDLNGLTSLKSFLTYGGVLKLNSWVDCLSGISPMLDYTIYCGIFVILLAGSSIIFTQLFKRNTWTFIWVILLLLLNLSLWPAPLLYKWWPMMKFYRHLSLLAPVTKIAICFWAAIVLDHILENKSSDFQIKKFACLCWGVAAGILLVFFQFGGVERILLITPSSNMYRSEVQSFIDWIKPGLIHWTFFHSIILLLTLTGLIKLFSHPQNKNQILKILIAIHLLSIYGYKLHETHNRTVPNPSATVTQFQPMPYSSRRTIGNWDTSTRSQFLQQLPLHTVKNWVTNSFIYLDEPGCSFRVDHWLKSFDQYLRTYWGQNLDDLKQRPLGLIYWGSFEFPDNHPSALKFSAVTEDKIQFFSKSFDVPEISLESAMMRDAEYRGDTPFLLKPSATANQNIKLTKNSRVTIPFSILNFSANHIVINMNVPENSAKWLIYSDVWHPDWKAMNNQKPTTIYRANLAYKAVALSTGQQTIEFRYFSQKINLLIWLLAWLSLAWVVGVLLLTIQILYFSDTKNNLKP